MQAQPLPSSGSGKPARGSNMKTSTMQAWILPLLALGLACSATSAGFVIYQQAVKVLPVDHPPATLRAYDRMWQETNTKDYIECGEAVQKGLPDSTDAEREWSFQYCLVEYGVAI